MIVCLPRPVLPAAAKVILMKRIILSHNRLRKAIRWRSKRALKEETGLATGITANTEPDQLTQDQFNSVHDVTHLFEFEIVRDAKFRSSWINGNTAIGSSDLECCAAWIWQTKVIIRRQVGFERTNRVDEQTHCSSQTWKLKKPPTIAFGHLAELSNSWG